MSIQWPKMRQLKFKKVMFTKDHMFVMVNILTVDLTRGKPLSTPVRNDLDQVSFWTCL